MEKVHPLIVSNGLDENYNPRLSERRDAVKVSVKTESKSCYSCTSINNLQTCLACKKLTCIDCLENKYCMFCSRKYNIKNKFCCFYY